MVNDTIIGDPLFTVTLPNEDEFMCYEVHGYAGKYFNLVSDRCLSVNAWSTQLPNNDRINRMSEIGLFAMNDNNECLEIKIDVNNCTGTLGGTEITSNYNSNGVTIRSYVRRWRVSVPNCHPMQAVMYVYCDAMDMLQFDIARGNNLASTSHGLLGVKSIYRRSTVIIMQRFHCSSVLEYYNFPDCGWQRHLHTSV